MSLLIDNLDSLGVIGERFHNRREQNTFSRFNSSVCNGKNNVLRDWESLSLDVFSVLLMVPVYDEWPDISTVKNMSNKCGIYELILSAFRSFVGGHDIWGCWFFIVPLNSFATWKTLSSLSDFELVNFNTKFSSKFSIMTFCISNEMVYTRTLLRWYW